MRHRHGYRKLNRDSSHRKAMLKNLAISLIESGKIETTLARAKELRSVVEKLITRAKDADLNTHRFVFSKLANKEATKKLIEEVAPNYTERNGGYTRIIKTRQRRGDASHMAFIELV